jgi:hypothetical protein
MLKLYFGKKMILFFDTFILKTNLEMHLKIFMTVVDIVLLWTKDIL